MRLKILLHHESTNISYSYGVLYNFLTPFRTSSRFILPNTWGRVGSLIFLGSRDKTPRDKAAEGFARTPQEKGFCFKVTALPTCHPPPPLPSMCLHQQAASLKVFTLLPTRTRGLDTQEPP